MTQDELNEILQLHAVWLLHGFDMKSPCPADLYGADLRGADLSRADLREADLRGADLREADLRGADLTRANSCGAEFYEADLRGTDLSEADLSEVDFFGVDLRGANLSGANLSGADFYRADLRGADLSGADLREADLYGAIIRDELRIEESIGYASRGDKHTFFSFKTNVGEPLIFAGSSAMLRSEYDAHIEAHYPGTDKARATRACLDYLCNLKSEFFRDEEAA